MLSSYTQRFLGKNPNFITNRNFSTAPQSGNAYVRFAKTYPFANNVIIATLKTMAADMIAQMGVERKTLNEIDWKRQFVFMLFGALYLGGFQYWYQINIFAKVFPNMGRFCSQTWAQKLKDGPGLRQLAGQVALDNAVLVSLYLPVFYSLKACVFVGGTNPIKWVTEGLGNLRSNWASDAYQITRLWIPLDFLCFSVPLYLRLPIRHIFSFVWTAYFSLLRGANKSKKEK